MKIPFSPPFIDDDVINEVIDSLKSGWITSGPKVKLLEEEVSRFVDVDRSVCVNSWTSGAILILKWFGVQPGDEVIVPAYTYSATALAVLHCGAIPVMVDISDDFTIDVTQIANRITDKTKIIMPVDIAGWPCDYDLINDIVNKKKIVEMFRPTSSKQKKLGRILVVADAAHSFGAKYQKKCVGQLTDITIFSFHAVKNITTAEGGAICLNLPESFNTEEEYRLMKLFSMNGQSKDALAKTQINGWKYDILFQGLKVNMPDMCAAVGLAQLRKYTDVLLRERERIALRYLAFFSKYDFFQLPPLENDKRKSCFHIFALRIHNFTETQRDKMMTYIFSDGVSVNVHFIPMPMMTLFKELGYNIKDFPVAYDTYSREISLPIYPQLSNQDVDFICSVILESYRKVTSND
jgi:dTDP-4-amino-4,6-dideoxygalactose transaminase